MANIRGVQGGQAIPVAITGMETGAVPLESVSPATVVSVNPDMTIGGAYSANDYVGPTAISLEFENVVRASGETGVILSAVLIDKALQSKETELWLFEDSVLPPTDNAPWSISDVDAIKCIGIIKFDTYYASAQNSVSIVTGSAIGFKATSTSIFGCLVTRGTPSYSPGDLVIKLSILQD